MNKIGAFLLLAYALTLSPLFAQDLISVEDLAKGLQNTSLVIISAGTEAEYAKVHISGAISLPYNSFDKAGTPEGILVDDAEMAKIFGAKGVTEKTPIVVYDEFDGRYASRMYMLLKYLGAKDVKMLDGGMEAWKKGRKPVTRNPSTISKTTFTAAPVKKYMATAQEVSSPKANTVLVDSRSPGEFKGAENNSKGHLPGAINIEYKELLDANGMLKVKAELEKVYASKGISKDKEIILYCSSGVRTGLHFLALNAILQYPNVKIYDGGYNEWIYLNPGKIAK
ncbi:MAG: sulfurtransferase [Bacteroidales bacterium]|nr:sulfurtransferase [Bacteroidales bacterium]MDZ4204982.1 sulfurtransferase [Bacteroidales bacterium]